MATTAPSSRTEELARPKPVPKGFTEDRRSVYWVERVPTSSGSKGTTVFVASARVDELCQPKPMHGAYQPHRAGPIWPVSEGAKSANASARVSTLAEARPVHPEYKYTRSVYTKVGEAAKTVEPTPRLEQLSEPKPHMVWANKDTDTMQEGEISDPITRVPAGAKEGQASGRVEQLAEAKNTHDLYKPERPVQWPVSQNAQNAIATQRLQQLSRPKSGKLRNDDYDPYKVTQGAKSARPSPRVTELSTPLPRKQRQKKT